MIGQLLFIQVFVFLGFIVFIRFLFYRQFQFALRRLQKLHEQNVAKEQQLREELERAKKERELEARRGKEEAQRIIEEARRASEVLRKNSEEQAKQELVKVLAEGREDLAREKQSISDNINAIALDLALKIIKYVLSKKEQEAFSRFLIAEVISEIGRIDKEQFFVKVEEVGITSSIPLDSKEKNCLIKELSAKLGTAVCLKENIDAGIIAGLIVTIGDFVIDGSLANRFKKALPYVKGK